MQEAGLKPMSHVSKPYALSHYPLLISIQLFPEMHTWLRVTVLKLILSILIVENVSLRLGSLRWQNIHVAQKHHAMNIICRLH